MRHAVVPIGLALGLGLVALVFAADPGLDLTAAALFYRPGIGFVGQSPLGEAARRSLYWIPALVAAGYTLLYLLKRSGRMSLWAPSGRGLAFVLLSFALGPGLLVNVILKEHSHRPRPYQTDVFGGTASFKPFYRFDGACARNCSFVSGEGATAVWTLAPALLVPPPWRGPAVAASLTFAVAVSSLRMAFGGHYLSDSLFAALFMGVVIWSAWRLIRPPVLPPSDEVRRARRNLA